MAMIGFMGYRSIAGDRILQAQAVKSVKILLFRKT